MGLDYSAGCVNFRDVGESLELILDQAMIPVGRLYRGGKIDFVDDASQIGGPATIVNLRRGADPQRFEADYVHVPASNDLEKYETHNRDVRRWLVDVLSVFADQSTADPILVHCTSGKDRTGVVIAALLLVVGIQHEAIIEEYLLSDGERRREWIEMAIAGMSDVDRYFLRVDLAAVRQRLLK